MQHILTWISYNISIRGTKILHLCQSGKICTGQSLVEGRANMSTDKQTHSLAAIRLFISSQQMEMRQQCSNIPLRIQIDQSEHLYFLCIGYKRIICIYNNYILKIRCTCRVFYLCHKRFPKYLNLHSFFSFFVASPLFSRHVSAK